MWGSCFVSFPLTGNYERLSLSPNDVAISNSLYRSWFVWHRWDHKCFYASVVITCSWGTRA